MPTCSVVVATYHRAHLVSRAICSVLAQTFPDFELIVVNDGGTDATDEAVASYVDARLRYIRLGQPHGSPAARNFGSLVACGEFVMFLDDDDELMPEYLAAILAAFAQRSSAGFAFTGRMRVRDEAHGERLLRYETYRVRGDTEEERRDWFLGKACVPGGGGGLAVRRRDLYAVGLWDTTLKRGSDADLLMRLAQRYDFAVVPACLYKLHSHGGPRLTDTSLERAGYSEQILGKHAALLARYPALLRDRQRRAGIAYYINGSPRDGRRMLLPLVRRYPWDRYTWGRLLSLEAAALLPDDVRRALYSWWRRTFKRAR